MTFEALESLVHSWASNKGLIQYENRYVQLAKVMEELGELSNGMLKEDYALISDAIGDVLVTMIILSHQLGFDMIGCLEGAYEVIKDRKGRTDNGTFIKE